MSRPLFRVSSAAGIAAAMALAWVAPADARVARIIIDHTQDLAGDTTYETITRRAFGELDPRDGRNALITDIDAAAAATGKATYVASFFIVKPKDMSTASGLMWHDVPNRGGRITISSDLRAQRDIGLSSGWQGGDPRLSLEECYGTHDGYVAAVKAAADKAACQGYLPAGPAAAAMGAKSTSAIPAGFPDDWKVLVDAAIASNVCDGGKCNPYGTEVNHEY